MEASSLTGLKRGEGQFLYGAIVYLAMWKWRNNDSIAAQFTLNYNVCNLDKATRSSVVVIRYIGALFLHSSIERVDSFSVLVAHF